MWTVGLWVLLFGFALTYTGIANWRTGGNGPALWEALGIPRVFAPGSRPATHGGGQSGSRDGPSSQPQPRRG